METGGINECLTTQFTNLSRSPRIKVDQEKKKAIHVDEVPQNQHK
jgi:hypothetical protein